MIYYEQIFKYQKNAYLYEYEVNGLFSVNQDILHTSHQYYISKFSDDMILMRNISDVVINLFISVVFPDNGHSGIHHSPPRLSPEKSLESRMLLGGDLPTSQHDISVVPPPAPPASIDRHIPMLTDTAPRPDLTGRDSHLTMDRSADSRLNLDQRLPLDTGLPVVLPRYPGLSTEIRFTDPRYDPRFPDTRHMLPPTPTFSSSFSYPSSNSNLDMLDPTRVVSTTISLPSSHPGSYPLLSPTHGRFTTNTSPTSSSLVPSSYIPSSPNALLSAGFLYPHFYPNPPNYQPGVFLHTSEGRTIEVLGSRSVPGPGRSLTPPPLPMSTDRGISDRHSGTPTQTPRHHTPLSQITNRLDNQQDHQGNSHHSNPHHNPHGNPHGNHPGPNPGDPQDPSSVWRPY